MLYINVIVIMLYTNVNTDVIYCCDSNDKYNW